MFGNVYAGKRVFVTGHTGFKGSWLCEWLLQLGAKVTGFSSYLPSNPSHFELLGLSDRLEHLVGDINDFESLKSAFEKAKPDLIFHLAAQPIVSESISNPVLTFQTNMMGTVHVLECARLSRQLSAAVFVTSDKCYENVEKAEGYRETDRLGGKDPYSASKAGAEIAIHAYRRTFFDSLPIATARAGNVIGGGDWAKDRVIPDAMRAWGEKHEAVQIRSPKSTRPWQHVLEPVSGYLWLAALLSRRDANAVGESFNFGPPSTKAPTVEALLDAMKSVCKGLQFKVVESSMAKKEAGLLQLDCEKADKKLAWKPTLDFDETVAMTASWYETFYNGKKRRMEDTTRAQIAAYVEKAASRGVRWATK